MTSLHVDGVRLLATLRQSHTDQEGIVFNHDSKQSHASYDTISDKLQRFVTKDSTLKGALDRKSIADFCPVRRLSI